MCVGMCVCVSVCAMISKTPKGSPSQVASRAWCCSVSFASINRAQQRHTETRVCASAHWAWLCRSQICIVAAATVLTGPTSGDPKKYLVTSRCAACKFQLKNSPVRTQAGAGPGDGAVAGAEAVAVARAWPADMDYAGSITIYSALNRKSTNDSDGMWQVKNWFVVSFC